MRIWIDNTGLQSASLCLEGWANPNHDYDTRGLLQLATLIIFGNDISLNGFEDDKVAMRSRQIADQLRDMHITDSILNINPVTKDDYAQACLTAADDVAKELCHTFNPDEHEILGGEPPDLPRGVHQRQVNFVSLAFEPEDSMKLLNTIDIALKEKAIGAVEYMLAVSPTLREEVSKLISKHTDWQERHSYQLNIFLRYHLNDVLAEQFFCEYAPAIARAELVHQRSNYIINALEKQIDDVVGILRGEPLGVPSIIAALLEKSRGQPEAVLEVAMELREFSLTLRNALEELSENYRTDNTEGRFRIHQEIRELGRELRRDLRLEKTTTMEDALEIARVLWVPFDVASWGKLVKRIWHGLKSQRTAVLTELVKSCPFGKHA